MRLCTTRMTAPRTWTVELRPQPHGTLLVCAHCSKPEPLPGRAARSEALAHLARHARCSLLPEHLRTCQCHERGCRWHPRSRGCAGPLLLVLSRELGGRQWRLADACAACAASMKEACVVPDTALTVRRHSHPDRASRRPGRTTAGQERELVRNMLSYLAASLPASVSAPARLLALQCALRSDPLGHTDVPAGLTRGMALGCIAALRQELQAARWLRPTADDAWDRAARLTDPLSGLPGAKARSQAADWALRVARGRSLIGMTAGTRLTALVLLAHTRPHSNDSAADAHHVARMCGASLPQLIEEVRRLAEHQLLAAWVLDAVTDDLSWKLPDLPHAPRRP